MRRHFLAAKANVDFLPTLSFLHDARRTKMRPRDGGLVSHGDRAMRLGDLRYSNLESLFKKREKGTKPWYLVCLTIFSSILCPSHTFGLFSSM